MKHLVLNGSLEAPKLHNLQIEKSKDGYLYDIHENKYLDLNSGLWNVTLGNDLEFNAKIKNSLNYILDNNLSFLDISSYNNSLYEETATDLLEFTNTSFSNFENVFFTNSGSEALELSYKIVNSIIDDKFVLTLNKSYHGTFYGGMALSGITKSFVESHNPDYRKIKNIDLPNNHEEEQVIFNIIENNKESIGAIFIEPIISSGGIIYSNIDFYNTLISICEDYGILVVFDEVATGFYKTKERFFFHHLKKSPDILCLSKGINNGVLPSGSVLINNNIYKNLNNIKAEHFSTQNGNLLCIKTVQETLKYYWIHDEALKENVRNIEETISNVKMNFDREIRNFGLMTAIPISSEKSLLMILEKLRSQKILTFCYETESEQGILLMPNINININILKKALIFILKTIEKLD
ncbi:hypothetical protein B4W74_12835 [Staphylococcus intermedius]|uniref:aminotransferase class III-fold pyridoxal phosphate-dependent enzyme n=1 Tax=Staphylococcus intermedius TaxID=1285 RepID=UPI000BBCF7A2|nr:aminotransferase class III-fold pyridoxal phosphate-dependent enzyme [Staphylococcus intermedius]PCF77658.1 hypothetical protein B4W74_12835 [Staphylococcus intermedius]PCF77809.1 hypothetical protein B4W70_12410 [Staphylococcus intermedius]